MQRWQFSEYTWLQGRSQCGWTPFVKKVHCICKVKFDISVYVLHIDPPWHNWESSLHPLGENPASATGWHVPVDVNRWTKLLLAMARLCFALSGHMLLNLWLFSCGLLLNLVFHKPNVLGLPWTLMFVHAHYLKK